MFRNAKLIYADGIDRLPVFRRDFEVTAGEKVVLTASALGVFEVRLNKKRVGDAVLHPGWQAYEKRIGVVEFDLTDLVKCGKNELRIAVAPGWMSGVMSLCDTEQVYPLALIAEIKIGKKTIVTDEKWTVAAGKYIFSDIYLGLHYDARLKELFHEVSVLDNFDKSLFRKVGGVPVIEDGTVLPSPEILRSPKGEIILDFGQNLVGYPVLNFESEFGGRVAFSFAEVLDKDSNFYRDNYRDATCNYDYFAIRGNNRFTPFGCFYGFRYLRIDAFPDEYRHGQIFAKIIHSDIRRTGNIRTGLPLLNRFFDNVIRGQLGNYVEVPTDCPQRDERLGWTGDAQIFIKAASYNFNVLEFFRKWLTDAVLLQDDDGSLPLFLPASKPRIDQNPNKPPRAGWTDFITIIPYELYRVYGDKSILSLTFDAMDKYIDCVTAMSADPNLFTGCPQYGDWLGLDAHPGSYVGASDPDLCASAYFLHSVEIAGKTAKILGKSAEKYHSIFRSGKAAFQKRFEPMLKTQTECALAIAFGLCRDTEEAAKRLVSAIHAAGDSLQTGFLGTAQLLPALSMVGETSLAYTLLLREDYPSWLYAVKKGATTVWEHWDGVRPDGSFWSPDMNSFNHYAYGAVVDWLYAYAAGITCPEDKPGYAAVRIAPIPDKRLGTLDAKFTSASGEIAVSWYYEGDAVRYRIQTPVPAEILINGSLHRLPAGIYCF